MANYLHVPLDPGLLRRLGTTAAARGMSVKAAASEAVSRWVRANARAVRAVADAAAEIEPADQTSRTAREGAR
jgi:hypothetical protein